MPNEEPTEKESNETTAIENDGSSKAGILDQARLRPLRS